MHKLTAKIVCISLLPKHPPLHFPQDGDAFSRITQTKLGILTNFENRFNDIGSKRGPLKDSADVASVDLIGLSNVFETLVLA